MELFAFFTVSVLDEIIIWIEKWNNFCMNENEYKYLSFNWRPCANAWDIGYFEIFIWIIFCINIFIRKLWKERNLIFKICLILDFPIRAYWFWNWIFSFFGWTCFALFGLLNFADTSWAKFGFEWNVRWLEIRERIIVHLLFAQFLQLVDFAHEFFINDWQRFCFFVFFCTFKSKCTNCARDRLSLFHCLDSLFD